MTDTTGPSDNVLDELPPRALKLMGAVSMNPYIRAALAKRGYTDAVHEQGWMLVLRASGYRAPGKGAAPATPAATQAIAAIDAWDEPTFRVAQAALLAGFPEQAAFVFEDLEAQKGVAAVVSVTTFLDRLDGLESGEDRAATRDADHAALAKLAARGIDADERRRLRDLLAVAQGSPTADDSPPSIKPDPKAEADRRQARIDLYAFYNEWSEIARADIKRRDHLIQLGLAKRKVGKKKAAKKDEPKKDEPKRDEPKGGDNNK
ncbi:MAG: hypothetical protein IT372_15885 [Polyangiaceae bacterium]|nr:hypothetical protein [Polyangiaceae bacterium]